MSLRRAHPRPLFIPNGPRKNAEEVQIQNFLSPNVGNLTPDLPSSPPCFPTSTEKEENKSTASRVGDFILLENIEGSDTNYKAINTKDGEKYICKVYPLDQYQTATAAYFRLGSHEHIRDIAEIILGRTQAYIFFQQNCGNLHSYVRTKKRLSDKEAKSLFYQMVSAVQHCHENGVVLKDLKLRKFVFKNQARTHLVLEDLEDAFLMSEDEWCDQMREKHYCPAYISPEILNPGKSYSGRCSDIWSLGVILYTMLVGRYPFHDADPRTLCIKILRGQFNIPDVVTSKAKCLIKSLLRKEPSERLAAEEITDHPWFISVECATEGFSEKKGFSDQTVPDIFFPDDDTSFFS